LMDRGDIATIYAIVLHIVALAVVWLYSRYLNRRGGEIQK
jgi:hypothetical protein